MPNFDNIQPTSTPMNPNVNPVVQASAASLVNVISYFITFFSGTNAITGFRLPRGFRGVFVTIPTAASTYATGGTLAYSTDGETEDIPIGKAMTGVASQPIFWVSDGNLCYPATGLV